MRNYTTYPVDCVENDKHFVRISIIIHAAEILLYTMKIVFHLMLVMHCACSVGYTAD